MSAGTKQNIRKRRQFPRTLTECVAPLVLPVLKKNGLEARLVQEWASIVGHEIASVTTPIATRFPVGKREEGTLTIAVEGAYALQLQYQIPLIIEKLAIFFGHRAISRITIKQILHTVDTKSRYTKAQTDVPPSGDDLADALNRLSRHLGG